jgi:DNA-binding CsgD family transcriptional regulator
MEIKYQENQHIDSVKYRMKINQLVEKFQLQDKANIAHFCIALIFRDNKKYFLSNMPDWAIEYHRMGGNRSDEVFDLELMKGKHYYLPRNSRYDEIQNSLVNREESDFGYFDIYSLIRRCLDCTFILLAAHTSPITDLQKIYEETRDQFEDFCIFLIDQMRDEIKLKNNEHKNLLILNDLRQLQKIIKCSMKEEISKITKREQECLKFLKNNYPPKLIAKNMNISEKSVRNYLESVKLKLQCNSLLEVVEKAIQYDL